MSNTITRKQKIDYLWSIINSLLEEELEEAAAEALQKHEAKASAAKSNTVGPRRGYFDDWIARYPTQTTQQRIEIARIEQNSSVYKTIDSDGYYRDRDYYDGLHSQLAAEALEEKEAAMNILESKINNDLLVSKSQDDSHPIEQDIPRMNGGGYHFSFDVSNTYKIVSEGNCPLGVTIGYMADKYKVLGVRKKNKHLGAAIRHHIYKLLIAGKVYQTNPEQKRWRRYTVCR